METKLQVISDIHLEFGASSHIPHAGDYLALCGDIGRPSSEKYKVFIQRMSERYKWVFLIAGNHEYYSAHNSVDEIDQTIREICASLPNVSYLQNSSHVIGGIRFIGATLWTNASSNQHVLIQCMSDYKCIKRKVWPDGPNKPYMRVNITPSYTTMLHKESVGFIIGEVLAAKQAGQKVVVLTHHLPTFRNISPEHYGNPINHGYATDLEHLIAPPIIAWCHGHTHYCTTTKVNGIPVHCNAHGYLRETTGFDPWFTIDLGEDIKKEISLDSL